MAEEQENVPIEISVASVASANLAAMPDNPSSSLSSSSVIALGMGTGAAVSGKNPRTIKPKPKLKPIDPKNRIASMKRDLEEGRKRLKPEEISNPFSKEFNKLLLKKELLEREITLHDIGLLQGEGGDGGEVAAKAVNGLYPTLNDQNFNTKIALRKEFFDTKMDVDNTKNVEEEAEILCNAQIELAPNQQFVRNFLSVETPYNSLLLYHGLGTGKTCSAISVAEEMRDYMKQMGIMQQIIVIASPNVQENFRLQLFDER